jgi:hypothetical protein
MKTMAEKRNLFYMVMEAEGDDLLQPMDFGGDSSPETPTEAPPPDSNTGTNDNPPPLEEANNADALSFPGEDGGGENQDTGENTDDGDNGDNTEENKEDEQLSAKADAVLNKNLYDQFVKRNEEVEDILTNLQTISSVLPIEIVNENDKSVNQLKSALAAGKNYVIEKFVDAKYGENALYFRKLDALYTLLMDKIDSNLKKAERSAQHNKS